MADLNTIRVLQEKLARNDRIAAEALKRKETEVSRLLEVIHRAEEELAECQKHFPLEDCLGCKVWGVLLDA